MENKAIGGYFELETVSRKNYLHDNLLHLNTARNCLEYILLARKYKHIYIPYFTCDVMIEPIEKLGLSYSFYDVDVNLEPIFDFSIIKDTEGFLLNNYFGVKGKIVKAISEKIPNVIIDNAQALFEDPISGIDTFYSPRKFLGIADGGFVSSSAKIDLVLKDDQSYHRMDHLLKRVELGAESGYEAFKTNDESLENQPIKNMSNLTKRILEGLDYDQIAMRRRKNFDVLHQFLGKANKLKMDIERTTVPMIYPFQSTDAKSIKNKLKSKRVFCATYWPNVTEWCTMEKYSYRLANEIVALPIDQRYSEKEMEFILKIIS